ncbi:hypothetical protein [Paenibacillus sp. QZ-Y1]|uniref:hypothetical protein n=1 Tax=Paenibacillus sp. QZ-Y1 TaxID=3414511 RepID=UPI003F78F7F8
MIINVDVNSFNAYCKKNEAHYSLKRQIINDKLEAGINGVEWLVLNLNPKPWKYECLNDWIEEEREHGKYHYEDVFIDSLLMKSDEFYSKHRYNWWMTVDMTLLHLFIMKANNYDKYFDFLQKVQSKSKIKK